MDQTIKLKTALKAEIRNLLKEAQNNVEMSFPKWKEALVSLIMNKANLEKEEIAINNQEIKKYFDEGKTPKQVYFDIWLQDAGNFRNLGESAIQEHQGTLIVKGKSVKTYKQNGDSSYSVEFDDGSKDTIYVSDPNGDWDKINRLHRSATSVNELARVANTIKISNPEAAQAYADANKGKWVSDMVQAVIDAGEEGITQPALAAQIGKGSQQAINPKVRELLAAGVFSMSGGNNNSNSSTPTPTEPKNNNYSESEEEEEDEIADDFFKVEDDDTEDEDTSAKKATPAKGVQTDAKKLDKVLSDMKALAAEYKNAKGTEREKEIVAKLKDLNKEKVKLEKLVKASLGDVDPDDVENEEV